MNNIGKWKSKKQQKVGRSKQRNIYINSRSGARGFIKNKTVLEDLEELIKQKEEELK